MIIVNTKNTFPYINKKFIESFFNNFFDSILYIDNEFDDVLINIKLKNYIVFYNLEGQYHNPIGPAVIHHKEEKILSERFYENGDFINKNKYNDYY